MLICGLDEAGKGPLIGPMVICGFMIDEKDVEKLKEIGAKDSKKLTPKQRERMFEPLKEAALRYELGFLTPEEIDEAVESDNTNLNWLEATRTAMILNKLNPDKAIIDCPSPNIKAYKDFLLTCLNNKKMELQLEHNAERFLPVAAASIIAKVTRDREIEKLKVKYGDFGSGYPADPKTKAFAKENCTKHPEIFRKSWATYKNMANQSNLQQFK